MLLFSLLFLYAPFVCVCVCVCVFVYLLYRIVPLCLENMYHLFKMAIRCTYKSTDTNASTSESTIYDGKYHTKIVDGLLFHSLRMLCFQSRSTHKLLYFCTMCLCVCDIFTVIFEDYNR